MKQIKKEYRDKSGLEIAMACARRAQDSKAEDLVVFDVTGLTSYTDFLVVMSGRSTRHVQGLAEAIEDEIRSKKVKTAKAEGLQEGLWVILDFDDVVVHIFYHEQRSFYNLDGLWHHAKRVQLAEE